MIYVAASNPSEARDIALARWIDQHICEYYGMDFSNFTPFQLRIARSRAEAKVLGLLVRETDPSNWLARRMLFR